MGQGRSRFNMNFFKNLDARGRIIVLIALVAAVLLVVYLGTRYFLGVTASNDSRVAVPAGIQSVPGGTTQSPAYTQAVTQASEQRAQAAQLSGASAIPTQQNYGSSFSSYGQCIICSDQSANVKNLLSDWVGKGELDQDTADALQKLADQNVPVSQYADQLDQLVKAGKLTPAQARALLDQYKKQHANAQLKDSGKFMDGLIKSGDLPVDAANQLLAAQKAGVSPAEYQQMLRRLVADGKISPATEAKLAAQYNQQKAAEAEQETETGIDRMAKDGEITPDMAAELKGLVAKNVPVSEYAAALQKAVADGKLTPDAAKKLLEQYEAQKAGVGPAATMDALAKKAAADGDYAKAEKLAEEAKRLAALQANNASPQDYANELKKAVLDGTLTPDEAQQLMNEYQGLTLPLGATETPEIPGTSGNTAFADLAKKAQEGGAAAPTTATEAALPGETPVITADELQEAQQKAADQAAQDKEARVEALMVAMSSQAQQLVNTVWQPPQMANRQGTPATPESKANCDTSKGTGNSSSGQSSTPQGAPIIKAGSILFAVLDTAVNSDYPDSPVLATIVAGPFKGAKLMGKLQTAKNVAGQLDRVGLNFTLMNMDNWNTSQAVNAYAIDPDTARTVMASQVNYHYLLRFGSIMATSFLQGYATALTNTGTSTTGIFGTSTTHPALSVAQNVLVGMGQVGTTLGTVTQNYVNIPPTVRVNSGVGLGILFMADVYRSS